jgi:putative DNA primase/helicase
VLDTTTASYAECLAVFSPTRSLPFTFFNSHTAQNKSEARYTLPELAYRIQHTTAEAKADLPWVKLARFGNKRTPRTEKGGGNSLRHDANVERVTGLEVDYDGEQMTPDEAVEILTKQGIASVIYTSPSHTDGKPRWRILCPFSEELPPDRRRAMVGRLNGLFRGIFARESWVLSQSYYLGSVRSNPAHRVAVVDGTPIDMHDDLDEVWIGPPGEEQEKNGKDHTPNPNLQADALEIAAALKNIPNDGPADWVWWNRVAMAVWAATGGSEMGWHAMDAWSARNPSYGATETRERWDHYRTSPPTKIGAGTLFYLAAEASQPAPPTSEADYGARQEQQDREPAPQSEASRDTAKDMAEPVPGLEDDRPLIRCVAGKVDIVVDHAEQALLEANADIFTRAEQLVRPGYSEVQTADGRTTKAAGLYALKEAGLIEELSRVATWQKFYKQDFAWRNIDPPPLIARVLADRKGRWKLRSVAGVITCPTMRPDGTILSEPGYDPKTRLYYMPDPNFCLPSIPERPNREAAVAALELLSGLLVEFPFVAPVDRSVALSMLISAVVRGALGMVPVHAFTAPTPGSGKSYLADVTTAITSGRRCPVITPGKSEEELEKRLGAMLLAGYPTISLDNMSSELSGDALCQVAERPIVRIRILGKSETPECEFRGVLIANGNNLTIAGDMTRRVLPGRLDAGIERPEDREFQGNPVKQVLKDRGKYVAAGLIIVRAYIAAGYPDTLKPLASYEEWSDLVRSPLVWLGCPDPVETMAEARAGDPVLTTLRTVLEAWNVAFGDEGKTTQQVAATFAQGFDPTTREGEALTELRAALAPVAAVRGIIDAVKLGYWLRKSKGRPAGGWKFTAVAGHAATNIWRVSRA